MGSLPHFLSDPPSQKQQQPNLVDPIKLKTLFKSQQKYLNNFFDKLDHSQAHLFTQTLLNSTGTIFITGVGKSGFVSKNISQTLVSLGIKSQFLSPTDALHGDIGILTEQDVLVMFSKSGNTEELLRLVPCARAKGAFLISVTSVEGNSLMGVKDVMKKQEELPVCKEGDLIMDQLVELTSKGCGCLLVIDDDYHLIGTFTDGDLRRTLKASKEGIFKLTVGEMCNRNPRTITAERMAVEAMQKMEAPPSPVQFLPVINEDNTLIGIVTLHGLVSAGL
ncbi:putative arabinose-5-phosphate isomerase [Helianthus annuus]|nr:putative arabinose-5-phosphate isomerase [Helianthus annuus]